MQNLKTFIEVNGPMSWNTCTKLFVELLTSDTAPQLELPLNLASFEIDDASWKISLSQKTSENDFAYQSPEVCLLRPTDERSIVYSLAYVFYACLTGGPVFVAKSSELASEIQISERPRPLSKRILNEKLPEQLDAFLEKAMQKNPKKRFADSKTFGLELQKILSDFEEQKAKSNKSDNYNPGKQTVFKFLSLFVLVPAFCFLLSHNSYTQKLIADSHPQARQPYHLSIDSSDYRLQMEFDDNKIEPDKSKKQIRILNLMTGKIMFATTKRKTFKEALEEAVRRRLDLKGADLSNQDLTGANLHSARFSKAFFINSKLNNANLYSCFLDSADFRGAEMKNCMLGDVHAVQTNFAQADLTDSQMMNGFFLQSNFTDANLINCNLTGAKLNQSKMTRANLTGATTKSVTRSAEFWDSAIVSESQLKDMTLLQSK